MFYDNYVRLCAQNGLTPSAAAKEIGVNKAAVSNWKYRKNNPSDVTIQKIADYFGVSTNVLTGEEGQKNSPSAEANGLVHLTTSEKRVLELFRQVPESEWDNLLLAVEVALRSKGLL